MTTRILIVDDDVELCALLTEFLSAESYEIEVYNRGDGAPARATEGDFALVVLDVMLPGMNGFDILREIRRTSDVPVILLTARGEDIDRIVGLELGADDYLPKPFNPRELAARIHAVLRRSGPRRDDEQATVLMVGDLELDRGARTVSKGGEPVQLTTVEFDLLALLLASAGKVVSRDGMAQTALGRELDAFDRSVDMHISKLRRKLDDGADGIERIKTVRGVGYIYAQPSSHA
jgi:two-component system, OmpR family, response regulator CpxR